MSNNIILWSVVTLLLISCATTNPLSLLQNDHPPLAAELSSRVAAHVPRNQDSKTDTRLSLPSAQDIDAIKKVAQILIMLGGQVIPGIIGDSPVGSTTQASGEVPHDPVSDN